MTEQTWTLKEDELLARLADKLKHDPQFSREDEDALRGLIEAYKSWRIFGRGAKWIVYILAALAGAIAAWNSIILEVKKWFV